MRRLALVLVVAGCRFGFDTASDKLGPDAASSSRIDAIDAPHLATDAPILNLDAGQCPNGYSFSGSSCYRVVHTKAGWLPDELTCEERNSTIGRA